MDIESTIERFIIDELLLGAGRETIAAGDPLISSRILDSLALMRLIVFLEERFGIAIDDGELAPDNFQTINHIKGLIDRKKQLAA